MKNGAQLAAAAGKILLSMPWEPEDAPRHTRKADRPDLRQIWADVANRILAETGDEGRAIRIANAVVARVRRKELRSWLE
jgi:uncharacterized protein YdaT